MKRNAMENTEMATRMEWEESGVENRETENWKKEESVKEGKSDQQKRARPKVRCFLVENHIHFSFFYFEKKDDSNKDTSGNLRYLRY